MTERDPFSVESGRGVRPPTTSGDRLMLLLAVVALVGGLFVAASKLLPPAPPEVAEVTPGPTTTGPTPSRTPRPTASPRPLGLILVEPGEPSATGAPDTWDSYWVRARQTLVIRDSPRPDGRERGTLEAGEVAITDSSPDGSGGEVGWRWIGDPEPTGWIAVEDETGPTVDILSWGSQGGTNVWTAHAGATGFVAQGYSADAAFVATSPDGISWLRAAGDAPAPYDYQGIAWGPAGWLTITTEDQPTGKSTLWVQQSKDGGSWTSLGSLGTPMYGSRHANNLSGSGTGYLAELGREFGRSSWWFSVNGRTWLEMPTTEVPIDTVVGGASGFYGWQHWGYAGSQTDPRGAFAANGDAWQVLPVGPSGPGSQVIPLGDGWLGMDQDPDSGAVRVWTGGLRGDTFAWDEPHYASVFAGSALALLAGDTRRAVAIVWDRATEEVTPWTSVDGREWEQISSPAGGFGGIPRQAAGSEAGVLVFGQAYVNDHAASALWLLDGDRWREIRSPVVAEHAAPPAPCPPLPTDALELGLLDVGLALRCFGNEPITIRAYSVADDRCQGCEDEGFEPAWLSWNSDGLSLMPFETFTGYFQPTALSPTLERSSEWVRAWLEVTGHFDDPAAQDCRTEINDETEPWYGGRQQMIDGCRQRFVVTAVTVVDGP